MSYGRGIKKGQGYQGWRHRWTPILTNHLYATELPQASGRVTSMTCGSTDSNDAA